MIKISHTNIKEKTTVNEQQLRLIQSELQTKDFHHFVQWIRLPLVPDLKERIKQKFPELINEVEDILDDVFFKLAKQILQLKSIPTDYDLVAIADKLIQVECKLATPSKENRDKNLGLDRKEYKNLCQKLKEGDETLIEKVYLSHFKRCLSFLIKQEQASEEIAHRCTMDALYEIRKDLMQDKIYYGNLGYYFTHRAKRKLYKQRMRKKIIKQPLDEVQIENETQTDSDYIREEMNELIRRAINQLCEECKNIIRAFYYEEENLKQIAKKLNKTHAAIRKQSSRCRNKLRKILGENFYQKFST